MSIPTHHHRLLLLLLLLLHLSYTSARAIPYLQHRRRNSSEKPAVKAQVIVGLSFGLIVLFITILVCAKASSKRIAKAEAQQRDIHMTEPVPRPPDFPWSPSFENVSDLPPPTYQEAIDNTGEARRLGTAPGNCAATLQSDGSRAAVAEESPAANR